MTTARELGSRSTRSVHVPIGSIIMYAGPIEDQASPPGPQRQRLHRDGWLVCDGCALPICNADRSRSVYWPLFEVIRTTYGGSGDHFNLPDYRGYFFRGRDFDNGQEPYTPHDPDRNQRTPSVQGAAPTAVGSTQDSVVQNHGHNYDHLVSAPMELVQQGEGPKALSATVSCATDYGYPKAWAGQTFSETRPVNISINLLIKFTHRVGAPNAPLSQLLGIADIGLPLPGRPFADNTPPRRRQR